MAKKEKGNKDKKDKDNKLKVKRPVSQVDSSSLAYADGTPWIACNIWKPSSSSSRTVSRPFRPSATSARYSSHNLESWCQEARKGLENGLVIVCKENVWNVHPIGFFLACYALSLHRLLIRNRGSVLLCQSRY